MRIGLLTRRTPLTAMDAVAVCLVLILIQVMFPVAPAHGQNTEADTTGTIVVHKYEQPELLRDAANGLVKDTSGLTVVPGATFTAKRVPGIDMTTKEGQRAAAGLTITEATQRVSSEPVAARETTDANGIAKLPDLELGLYHVQETTIPSGFVGAAPFLVSLPLTHPTDRDTWLTTVHVYPKNSRVNIILEVIDQDAVKIGDTVRWISRSAIPFRSELTGYRVDQIIHPQLSLTGGPGGETRNVTVTLDAGGVQSQTGNTFQLREGIDYRLNYSGATRTLEVLFLEPGLRKLEQAVAATPGVQVLVDYATTVRGEGLLMNEAVLYPSQSAIDDRAGVRDGAVTKWGPLSVAVMQRDDPSRPVAGAIFELYATPQDAFARRNPVTINGVSRWATDDQGRLVINGLRFSEFVNGLDRETSDPLFRDYWVVPVSLPDGWSWVDQQPLGGTVNSELEYQTLVYLAEQKPDDPDTEEPGRTGLVFGWIPIPWIFDWFGGSSDGSSGSSIGVSSPMTPGEQPGNQPETPAGIQPDASTDRSGLASTGAQVIGLVMFGLVLMIAGAFLVLGRKRRNEEMVES